MKIAILTSGGDSAGMNAVVRSVVKAAILKECETWIVREGYEGLVRGNTEYDEARKAGVVEDAKLPAGSKEIAPAHYKIQPTDPYFLHNLRFGDGPLLKDGTGDYGSSGKRTLKGRYIVRVGWDDVRAWFAEGGTLIGTARSVAFRTREGRLKAARNLILEGIDALVVCGGDGSLTGADVFRAEWPGLLTELKATGLINDEQIEKHAHLRIVGLVGSIDNDMSLTDLTIGAPTALHRICEAIDNINSTAFSHSRAFVLEVMGRHCGWLALLAGVAGGADFIFIPESPPPASDKNGDGGGGWEDGMCDAIHKHRKIGKRKTIVIVAEGAHDADLQPIRAEYVKEVLTERLGLDTRVTQLGHTQRGGRPCAFDRIMPTLQGVEAVDALLESTPDTPSYMIGIQENKITRVPLMEAVAMTKAVAEAITNRDFKKAMSLRDPEFIESLEGFYSTSELKVSERLPSHTFMRVGIMHMGAPAGGINAATRAAVRYCLRHGHTPLGIHNGFRGLLDDNVQPLGWLEVDTWMARGGSELGTNRTLPSVDIGCVASKFQAHKLSALLLIGGFEAFAALLELEEGRKHYPSFRIPMVHLPATISNNVPMTDYSLGSDTSLNALVDACDAIKQSASASRNRVFVVETQGGMCGYLATMGALATGACLVYTPEDGMNLDTLRRDVRFLKTRYALDVKGKSEGRLVIRSEQASSVYTTEFITKMLKEEGGSLFDSRSASLGHTLQGGIPSPIDRARAVRLSLKCMSFLERQNEALQAQSTSSSHGLTDVNDNPGTTNYGEGTGQDTEIGYNSTRHWHAPPESAAVITIQSSSIKWVPVREMVEHADMKHRRGKKAWWIDSRVKDLVESLVGRPQLVGLKIPGVSAGAAADDIKA
ncbi:hypothetical protein CCMSSC00406_0008770 [Pleurotus cornucopiae]|uniref:Uncharacterized protein n=1 Tax=Pleurotus cornucopiae TaxID=5321 RepID=A0ACB7J747_PLECO|nr:hypothetical protein CCMSSC00406_0008770 [Pleurotus cornucopiae]